MSLSWIKMVNDTWLGFAEAARNLQTLGSEDRHTVPAQRNLLLVQYYIKIYKENTNKNTQYIQKSIWVCHECIVYVTTVILAQKSIKTELRVKNYSNLNFQELKYKNSKFQGLMCIYINFRESKCKSYRDVNIIILNYRILTVNLHCWNRFFLIQ